MPILEIIKEYLPSLKKSGRNYSALCPFHNDHNPSLLIYPTGGFKCLACGESGNVAKLLEQLDAPEDLVNKFKKMPGYVKYESKFNDKEKKTVEETRNNLINSGWYLKATYIYHNIKGSVQYIKERWQKRDDEKTFIYYLPGNKYVGLEGRKQVLYGLIQFENFTDYDKIYLAEGEKCADICNESITDEKAVILGFLNFKSQYSQDLNEYFTGKDIIVFADNDDAGKKKAEEITEVLKPVKVKSIKFVSFPEFDTKYDIGDYILNLGYDENLINKIETVEVTYETPAKKYIYKLSTVPKPDLEFLLGRYLVKGVSILAGMGSSGKSYFALFEAILLSQIKVKSLVWLSEDRMVVGRRIEQLIKRYKFDRQKVEDYLDIIYAPAHPFIKKEINTISIHQENVDLLSDFIKYSNPKFIVLDPLLSFYNQDENKNDIARSFLDFTNNFAFENNVSILFLHHTSKAGYNIDESKTISEKNMAMRGASAFQDGVRTVELMYVANKSNPDKKYVEIIKANYEKINHKKLITEEDLITNINNPDFFSEIDVPIKIDFGFFNENYFNDNDDYDDTFNKIFKSKTSQ